MTLPREHSTFNIERLTSSKCPNWRTMDYSSRLSTANLGGTLPPVNRLFARLLPWLFCLLLLGPLAAASAHCPPPVVVASLAVPAPDVNPEGLTAGIEPAQYEYDSARLRPQSSTVSPCCSGACARNESPSSSPSPGGKCNCDAGGLHKYLYCHSDPINGTDSSGEDGDFASLVSSMAITARSFAQTAFSVVQAYNRAQAVCGAIQDVSMVTGALAEDDFDGATEIIDQIIYNYAMSRLQGYVLGAALGTGGKVLGIAAGQLAKLKITPATIQKTRDWYFKNKIKRPDGFVTTRSGYSVQMKNGFPDFSPYSVKTVKISLTGGRAGDFAAADKLANITEKWREDRGLVWHHNQSLGKMELVPKALNNPGQEGLFHAGGVKIYELLYGVSYGK